MSEVDPDAIAAIVAAALAEDLGARGDVTTDAVVAEDAQALARLVARSALVVAGLPWVCEVFRRLDPGLRVASSVAEGQRVEPGTILAEIRGAARPLLRGERTALNFLMRACGIATATAAAVGEIAGTGATLLDTRKTAPGLRALDKYAVAAGGGTNHRLGLHDAVMIKDTHLGLGSSINAAVARVRAAGHEAATITVEVGNLTQLNEAIAAGAGRALLDNMDLVTLRRAVATARGRIQLEASGGLRPGELRAVAETGVDFLSVGWLTHSVAAADVAMDVEPLP